MSTESTEPKPCAWLAIYAGLPVQATTDEPTAIRWRRAGGDVRDMFERATLDAAVARAVAEERERCAEAAREFLTQGRSPLGLRVAAAIRRTQQEMTAKDDRRAERQRSGSG